MTLNNVRVTIIDATAELDSIIGLMNTFTANRGLRTKAASSMVDVVTAGFEGIYSAGFRNIACGNCRNDPSSDVVDAGTDVSAVANDLDGDTRIGTFDVGAFESCSRTDRLL